MKDIHRIMAKRSMKDSADVYLDVVEEYDMVFPEDLAAQMVAQFSIAMYEHRVQRHRMKEQEAKQESMFPEGDGSRGRH